VVFFRDAVLKLVEMMQALFWGRSLYLTVLLVKRRAASFHANADAIVVWPFLGSLIPVL
jgi:hypothetical protein